jgi:hypothetical protein
MGFTLAPLLMHSEFVPPKAREALRAASYGPSAQRIPQLESAARILYLEASLDCRDAREIVGLDGCAPCA